MPADKNQTPIPNNPGPSPRERRIRRIRPIWLLAVIIPAVILNPWVRAPSWSWSKTLDLMHVVDRPRYSNLAVLGAALAIGLAFLRILLSRPTKES